MGGGGRSSTKSSKKSKPVLQPGDGDASYKYLTPTQRRNARKRRAKQQQQQQAKQSQQQQQQSNSNNNNNKRKLDAAAGAASNNNDHRPHNKKRRRTADPSLRYLSNPRAAPVVKAARQFFGSLGMQFPVYCGRREGWRTVAKLAVRNDDSNGLLSLGLFAPGTHRLLSSVDCAAHHPSINRAVALVEQQARQLQISAYDETTGEGRLRHALFQVQRHTSRVQLALVWNTSSSSVPEEETAAGGDVGNNNNNNNHNKDDLSMAEKLCQALLVRAAAHHKDDPSSSSSSSSDSDQPPVVDVVEWHSIWVHSNASWKHSNAIVSPTGGWKQLYPTKVSAGDDNAATTTTTMMAEYLTFPREAPSSSSRKTKKRQREPDDDDDSDSDDNSLQQIPLHFSPQVFRQANLDAFAALVGAIRARVVRTAATASNQNNGTTSKPLRILELYGGVGTIGLHVAAAAAAASTNGCTTSLVCSDENPHNQACFEASARALMQQPRKKKQKKLTIRYETKSAAQMVQNGALRTADVVIVDPPRKGLEASVSAALAAANDTTSSNAVRLLVYVSCGFEAFRRDHDILVRGGGWRVDRAEGHILFPGSNAIETLAFFVRHNHP